MVGRSWRRMEMRALGAIALVMSATPLVITGSAAAQSPTPGQPTSGQCQCQCPCAAGQRPMQHPMQHPMPQPTQRPMTPAPGQCAAGSPQCAAPGMPATPMNTPASTPARTPANPPTQAVPNTPNTRSEADRLPLPPRFPLPAARLALKEGKVTVRLVNFTNAKISFEAIGVTGDRVLSGVLNEPDRSTSVLELLPTPSNLVFYRADRGFLLVRPTVTPQGELELVLTATSDINQDVNYVNVTERGEVYLY